MKILFSTDEIWELFGDRLKRFIFSRVHNNHDAEDILQDIFCKIHNNVHNLRDTDKLEAWIVQIARNTIADYYRRQKIVTVNSTEMVEDGLDAFYQEDNTYNYLSCIKPMIDNLPEKYRQAIILTEYNGLTQKEMAEKLGLSLSGAKSRVQRAREKVKKMLLECCHFEFDRLGNILDYQHKKKTCPFCDENNHAD